MLRYFVKIDLNISKLVYLSNMGNINKKVCCSNNENQSEQPTYFDIVKRAISPSPIPQSVDVSIISDDDDDPKNF